MGDIKVTTKNIGGTENVSVQLKTGSVNIIEGTSASGKSSLMRGIHLGLVGPPHKHLDEMERIYLNDADPSSSNPILRRKATEGSVKISHDGGNIEATIDSRGAIKGKGSNEKAIYTSMVSELPKNRLYGAVFDTDNGDDFRWVSEVVSEAKDLLVWQSVLNPLDRELASLRERFEQWKISKGDATDQSEAIKEDIQRLREKENDLREKHAVTDAAQAKKLKTALFQLDSHQDSYADLNRQVTNIETENQLHLDRVKGAEAQEKIAQRRLNEANDLQEMELIEPDMEKLDGAITKATEAYDAVRGDSAPSTVRIVDAYIIVLNSGEKVPPKLADAIEKERAALGDESKLGEALDALNLAKKNRDSAVRKFMELRQKIAESTRQAAAARGLIKDARGKIAGSNAQMGKVALTLPKKRADRDASKNQLEISKAEVDRLKADAGSSPELDAVELEISKLEKERDELDGSATFEIRLASLQMMPNEGIPLTEELGAELLGDGSGGKILKSFVNSNLSNRSVPEIRSLIKEELVNGILIDIGATSKWVTESIEDQLQKTRKEFNKVGTTLFANLSNSKIKSIELDTNYRIRQTWADGSITGLAGSGGERSITSAAILIAMRKAFTPDVPILMIDGVLEKIDEDARGPLFDFLKDYAKSDGVTIVVSILDGKSTDVKVSVL